MVPFGWRGKCALNGLRNSRGRKWLASLPPKHPVTSFSRSGSQPPKAMKFLKIQSALSILIQQTRVLIDDQPITITCRRLQARTIDDFDLASCVSDEARFLQHTRRNRYGWSVNAEHLAEKFVRQRKTVAFDAVMRMQKPACTTFLDLM